MDRQVAEAWSEAVNTDKMDKKTFWIIVGIAIAVLLIVVVWQTAKISDISSAATAAKSAASAASSGSGMVGGC